MSFCAVFFFAVSSCSVFLRCLFLPSLLAATFFAVHFYSVFFLQRLFSGTKPHSRFHFNPLNHCNQVTPSRLSLFAERLMHLFSLPCFPCFPWPPFSRTFVLVGKFGLSFTRRVPLLGNWPLIFAIVKLVFCETVILPSCAVVHLCPRRDGCKQLVIP